MQQVKRRVKNISYCLEKHQLLSDENCPEKNQRDIEADGVNAMNTSLASCEGAFLELIVNSLCLVYLFLNVLCNISAVLYLYCTVLSLQKKRILLKKRGRWTESEREREKESNKRGRESERIEVAEERCLAMRAFHTLQRFLRNCSFISVFAE